MKPFLSRLCFNFHQHRLINCICSVSPCSNRWQMHIMWQNDTSGPTMNLTRWKIVQRNHWPAFVVEAFPKRRPRNHSISCLLPFPDAGCHILMAALVFGTNYVWKCNRKYAVHFLTRLMKMDGWVAWMGPDTWQSIVSLHQCTGVSSIRSHISPGGNEDVPSNGKHNGCRQMEDISL